MRQKYVLHTVWLPHFYKHVCAAHGARVTNNLCVMNKQSNYWTRWSSDWQPRFVRGKIWPQSRSRERLLWGLSRPSSVPPGSPRILYENIPLLFPSTLLTDLLFKLFSFTKTNNAHTAYIVVQSCITPTRFGTTVRSSWNLYTKF